MKPRDKRGRYISRYAAERAEERARRRPKRYVVFMLVGWAALVGAAGMPEDEPPAVCGLDAVVCPDEPDTPAWPAEELTPADRAVRDIPHSSPTTTARIRLLYAIGGELADEMARTIWCETQWYNVRSFAPYPDGRREESYGLAQIHLPDHDVTVEQAMTPEFAFRWMLDNWDTAKWYGYDRESERCTNGVPEYW